jgi:hypothetical protein
MDACQDWNHFLLENMCSMDVMPRSIGNFCVLFVSNLALYILELFWNLWSIDVILSSVGSFYIFVPQKLDSMYTGKTISETCIMAVPHTLLYSTVLWSSWCNSLLHGVCQFCSPRKNRVSLQLTLTVLILTHCCTFKSPGYLVVAVGRSLTVLTWNVWWIL